jgi:LysR family transcriptional regulator, carnitine catabolism transcriptional activator
MQRVQSGYLDIGLGSFFKKVSSIRRTPFFRFVLMVMRPDSDPAFRPASTTWGALKAETLISLPPTNPVQQLINDHLAQAGVIFQNNIVLNYLETVIAMVEAGKGLAIIPSFAIPACRQKRPRYSANAR